MYADGSADVSSVVFTYKDIYVAPVEAELTILYQTEDQTVIASDSKLLTPGEYTIRPDGTLIGSYVLSGEQSHVVYVDAQGGIAPGNTVVFTVHQPEVTVLVHYQDELGRSVAPDQSHTYTADGTYTITANPEGLAENYELAPGLHSTVTVTVIDGMASQSDVYFYYQQKQVAPTMANVTVHYYDTEGNEIADAQTVSLEAGKEHWLKAEPVNLPEGYELVSEETILVEVYENGTFSPQEIGFYYRPIQQEAVKADVIVRYCDDRGEEIATSQTHSLEDGTHIIEARPDDLPEGYVIFEGTESAVEVVVRNGVPTKSQVVFYYQYQAPVEEVVEFVLPVYYYDTEGNEIAESQTVKAAPGTYSIRANPVDLPEGSELRMDETLTVTVFDDGTTEPEEIAFYYYVPDKKATIIVSYVDDSGQAIIDPFTEELDAGSHTIGADPDRLPEGYDPDSAEPVQVYVSKNGEASPNQVTLSFERLVVEAPIPVGENVYRYAVVNDNDVAFRSEPSTAKGRETVIKRIDRNSKVYVLQELYNDKNEVWAMVNINGQEGYMMSEFLDMMTQQESDAYAAAFTPAPTFTPVPTASPTPTATPTGTPTATPTATPTTAPTDPLVEEVTAPPTATPTLEPLPEDEPTDAPTDEPTATPTGTPTDAPTDEPTATPTETPTDAPTDEPTATPTEMPTDAPTDEPTATPTETPTDEPTATPTITPAPYAGYALTTRSTALRTGISASDMTIIQILEANELVKVADQMTDPATGELWSIVSTMNNQPGYVQDASLRYISDKEAQAYLALWEEQNQSPEPSEYASPSAEPMQLQGYGVVLGDDVPFRQMASEFSRIIDNLSAETYVYITGQTYVDGTAWHSVNYEGHWGYIRADLVRMLTLTEEEEYLAQLNASPSPDPETTNQPFDANGLSSYGYVECSDNSSVNWRETPSTNGKRIGELKRYALCLVLSSEQVNGVTWYKINYGDKTGYIHGDFFKQMTITELENFLGSDEYFQGVTNNSPAGDTGMDDVGFTGTGGIVSREDQWVNNNPDVYASFAPFNPIATVAPIGTATPTLEPLPGQATDAPTESPTPTFNPLPDVTYPTTDEGSGGSGIIWAVVIGLLLLTVGGVFALVRYQQNKRRIAMRAAQRRAQAARAQQQRPYARTTASAQPRTGTYPNQQTAVRQPVTRSAEEAPAQYTPYTGTSAYGTGNAFRPAETSANEEAVQENAQQPTTQRVGRRTAYRRAQEAAGRNQENNDLKM